MVLNKEKILELIKKADQLDRKGLFKEADEIDKALSSLPSKVDDKIEIEILDEEKEFLQEVLKSLQESLEDN